MEVATDLEIDVSRITCPSDAGSGSGGNNLRDSGTAFEREHHNDWRSAFSGVNFHGSQGTIARACLESPVFLHLNSFLVRHFSGSLAGIR